MRILYRRRTVWPYDLYRVCHYRRRRVDQPAVSANPETKRKRASELVSCCAQYPQVLVNVPVASRRGAKEEIMASEVLAAAIRKQEEKLGQEGRILLRPSGTEALIRVMVEAKTEEMAHYYAEELVNVVKSLKIS